MVKRIILLAVSLAAFAAPQAAEIPIWRITITRVTYFKNNVLGVINYA